MKTALARYLLLFICAAAFPSHQSSPVRRLTSLGDLFSRDTVPVIEISLSPESTESLRRNPREDVSACVRIDGREFPETAVRLKGSGSFQPIDDKPSFTLNLNKFSRSGNSVGLSKIYLNNSVEDSTFVQEKLASDLFAAAGVPTPEVGHALVTVNGRSRGLYVLKEGFSPEFLAWHFLHPGGVLFDKTSLELAQLSAAMEEPNLDLRWAKLQNVVDVDEFISFIATEVMICHWDGYALANNNFRAYRDPQSVKLTFLPAGMDQTFGNPAYPIGPEMSGTIAHALIETPVGQARFTQRLKELFDRFDPQLSVNNARAILENLRPSVSLAEYRAMRCSVDDLSARIFARHSYLALELNPSSL